MLKYALIVLVLAGFMTTADANKFTTEDQLTHRYIGEIADFWQQGEFANFKGVNNSRINYAVFTHKTKPLVTEDNIQNKCLVISSGRSEGYLKYKELSFDLFNLGYDIFLIDHRGQGLSERALENPNKGYVENFQFYVDDLAMFINDIVSSHCTVDGKTKKPYLLAHSMGGAIAARYLQDYPNSIQAAVLSSPMLGFNSGGIPEFIMLPLVKLTAKINQWFDDTPWYFIGQKNYRQKRFSGNSLMHSKLRFQKFNQIYQKVPELQLGGITVKWLTESINALDTIFAKIDQITTPTIVLQAGADKIVSNQAQNAFCQQLHQQHPQSCPNGKPLVIEGAFHELFFESDKYRQQALSALTQWLDQH